jgi:hypothetical protein
VLNINVAIAATTLDIQAESIAGAVAGRSDITLIESRVLSVQELDELVTARKLTSPCCIVLVGPDRTTEQLATRYLAECADCVVLRVSAPFGDAVRLTASQVGLEGLLDAVGALVRSAGEKSAGDKCSRAAHIQLTDRARRYSPGLPLPAVLALQ